MGKYNKVFGLIAILFGVSHCHGAVILFDSAHDDAVMGVRINPTGPKYAPLAATLLQSLGVESPLFPASQAARYYSGNAVFKEPIATITMTIENASVSVAKNRFRLVAFDKRHRVAVKRVVLSSIGDNLPITVSAPSIDKIKWSGGGWSHHAYVITNLDVTFTAPATAPTPGQGPVVSASAPEPGFIFVGAPIFLFGLTRRRRTPSYNTMRDDRNATS
ncbi:MAG TPA: hypothetical protein VG326_06595 [Tepidisphaeraceae bacterium]|jgi:hypothetical protein|nr:hypothetical protein [Tepidisphaeraceae bacterium]